MNQSQISAGIRRKAALARAPLSAALELTPMCNFSCKMCYVRRSPAEVREAGGLRDAGWWLDVARQARDCGLLFPLITGGEPMTYPELPRLLSGLRELGLLPSMNTNASLIGPAELKWLSRCPLVRFNITLYGAGDSGYGALCGDPGGFTKVDRAIRALREAGYTPHLSASITPEDQDQLQGIIAYGRKLGIPVQVATYMFPPVRRREDCFGQNQRLSPEEAGRLQAMADFWQYPPQTFLRTARHYAAFVPLAQIDFDSLQPGPGEEMACTAGRCSCWVDWQGGLMPCGMNGEPRWSLDEMPFARAWDLARTHTEGVRACGVCQRCPNRDICHVCATMVYNETGTYQDRPLYFCRMTEAAAEQYRALAADMDGTALTEDGESGPLERECDF